MGEKTNIEWTSHTGNFWHGCMKVSPGCTHCYAETFSKRVGRDIWGPAETTERWRTKGPWKDIFKWNKQAKADGVRRTVFCQSMSDFFEDHPQLDEWHGEAFGIIEQMDWLDFQILTKRIENVRRMVPAAWLAANEAEASWTLDDLSVTEDRWRYLGNGGDWAKWPSNVWIGTSVETQHYADERIPHLLELPAPVRFLSCEPLLGPIDLSAYIHPYFAADDARHYPRRDGVEWVIVGGESGPGARRMDLEWAKEIVFQCSRAGVPVFMKQYGSVLAKESDLKHAKGGDIDEWPQDLRYRQFPDYFATNISEPHDLQRTHSDTRAPRG